MGNTHARHIVLDLLVPCLLGTSSSCGTWYCQLHHAAGDVVCISSLDMSKPTKTATASSMGETCRMRRIYSFLMWSRLDTPRIPRSILVSVVAIFLLLVTFIPHHSRPYVRAGLLIADDLFDIIITPYAVRLH